MCVCERVCVCVCVRERVCVCERERECVCVKSSHLYLYSAFNSTDCVKAALQYQIGK